MRSTNRRCIRAGCIVISPSATRTIAACTMRIPSGVTFRTRCCIHRQRSRDSNRRVGASTFSCQAGSIGVSDEQLVELFASALAVPFVPVQEDYGLVMVEAFHSRKPVVTCLDSGEPAHFVKHGVNGLVVEPTADALVDALQFLIDRPERAAEMGDNGF